MSLGGSPAEADRASPRAQELSRRFRRPDMPSTPPSIPRSQQQQLPKVLSHVAKAPPTGPEVEKMTNNHSVEVSNEVSQPSEVKQDERGDEDTKSSDRPPLARKPSMKVGLSSERLIGLELLQEQVRRLALRKGFTLNIMVVGTKIKRIAYFIIDEPFFLSHCDQEEAV